MKKKVVIARLSIIKGKEDEFISAASPLIDSARKEPGNLAYTLYQNPSDPGQFIFYEEYKDDDAFKAHGQTEAYKAFSGEVKGLLSAQMDVQIF